MPEELLAESTDLAEIEARELATIQAEMEADALKMQENLVVKNNRISNKGKTFTLPDGTVMGPALEVVILGYIQANAYFAGVFDVNNPQPPTCFAYAKPGDELKPTASVEKPECDVCKDCSFDEFGSANGGSGKGKACKNEYQVAVIVPSHSPTEVMTLSISATGLDSFNSSLGAIIKNFKSAVKGIVTAEFTDALYPVVKITGGVPNPDAIKHFMLSKEAVQNLVDQ